MLYVFWMQIIKKKVAKRMYTIEKQFYFLSHYCNQKIKIGYLFYRRSDKWKDMVYNPTAVCKQI